MTKQDWLHTAETLLISRLIDTIEESIVNVFEREINKNALSDQDKIELNKVFSNVRKKTLEN